MKKGKRIKKKQAQTIEGVPVGQYIEQNADLIWLHQHEMWELIPVGDELLRPRAPTDSDAWDDEHEIPF